MLRPASVLAVLILLAVPAFSAAQDASSGTIAGVVRDEGGAVLPGVTVEAASPALIERTRTAVTDGEGRYRLVDLRIRQRSPKWEALAKHHPPGLLSSHRQDSHPCPPCPAPISAPSPCARQC